MKSNKIIKVKELIKPVSIGMNKTDKEVIENAATKVGVSFSDFMRQAALHAAKNS